MDGYDAERDADRDAEWGAGRGAAPVGPAAVGARGWLGPVVGALVIGLVLVGVGAVFVVPRLAAETAPQIEAAPRTHPGNVPTGDAGTGASASSGGQPSAPLFDPCVIGTWRMTSGLEEVPVSGYGTVHFTVGGGVLARYGADGTGSWDASAGVTETTTVNGHRMDLVSKGTGSYQYVTSAGSIWYRTVKASGTITILLDGATYKSFAIPAIATPDVYSCSGDSLRLTGSGPIGSAPGTSYAVELSRVSHTA